MRKAVKTATFISFHRNAPAWYNRDSSAYRTGCTALVVRNSPPECSNILTDCRTADLHLPVILTPLQVFQLDRVVTDHHRVGHDPDQIVYDAQELVVGYHLFLHRAYCCLPARSSNHRAGPTRYQAHDIPRKPPLSIDSITRPLAPSRQVWHNSSINVPASRTVAERPFAAKRRYRVWLRASLQIGPQVTSRIRAFCAESAFSSQTNANLWDNNVTNVPAPRKVASVACFSNGLKIGPQVISDFPIFLILSIHLHHQALKVRWAGTIKYGASNLSYYFNAVAQLENSIPGIFPNIRELTQGFCYVASKIAVLTHLMSTICGVFSFPRVPRSGMEFVGEYLLIAQLAC